MQMIKAKGCRSSCIRVVVATDHVTDTKNYLSLGGQELRMNYSIPELWS